MILNAVAYSVKGIREHNEDSFLLDDISGGTGIADSFNECEIIDKKCCFAVADGMGGHDAGDIASAFVLSSLKDMAKACDNFNKENVEQMLCNIHKNLINKGREEGTPNMGSTFVGLFINNEQCGFANVGDSRLYRLRNGFLQQVTRDDSLCEIIPDAPKNIVLNAIGAGIPEIDVDSRFSSSFAVSGDLFLLCSDGVHGYVTNDFLESKLKENITLKEKSEQIVKEGLKNGSDDNSTVVLVSIC